MEYIFHEEQTAIKRVNNIVWWTTQFKSCARPWHLWRNTPVCWVRNRRVSRDMQAILLWLIPGVLACWWSYAWKGHSDNWVLKNLSTGIEASATGESLNSGDPAVHPTARHSLFSFLSSLCTMHIENTQKRGGVIWWYASLCTLCTLPVVTLRYNTSVNIGTNAYNKNEVTQSKAHATTRESACWAYEG